MARNRPLLALALGATMLLAACGSSGSNATTGTGTEAIGPKTTATTSSPTTTGGATTSTPAASNAPVVLLSTTPLGLTLTDASGHTLYEYQPDPAGSSTCTGGCATIWPPLTTSGTTVVLGAHLTASLFSTVAGAGGAHIVAISGHPLYRFSGDKKAGDTKGQGFGGVWHAAGPLGNTM